MKIKSLLFVALIAISTVSAFSQATPLAGERQQNQGRRIKNGVKSGELTVNETQNLIDQQKNVQKHKKVVKADGVVTKKERAGVQAHQNAASSNIYKKKHNKRDRN